ncbi:MAG TPA: hypothetical protein DCL86_15980 [Bacteroidales bacterium]|nr:hypothetical protein [Bacteroidales bacterium]
MKPNKSIVVRTLKWSITFTLLVLLVYACKKYEEYPPEPTIEFLDFTLLPDAQGIDQRGVLRFGFTDGDGNIGLTRNDTVAPFDYNLFIRYFEKQNGSFEEVFLVTPRYIDDTTLVYDTASFNGRIPPLMPAGKNKAISGEIQDTIFVNNPLSDFDTIKFELYIRDRDLNNSNIISTPPIVIKKQ